MSPRIRLGIIIMLVVLALAGGVFLFYQSTSKNGGLLSTRTVTPNAPEPTTTGRFIDSSNFTTSSLSAVTLPTNSLTVTEATTSTVTPLAIEKKGVERFARVFTEIYGSFSTDNNYQNIFDVRSLVSPQLWEKIKPPTSPKPASSFIGVSTQVLLTTLADWSAGAARVDVTAQRTETKAGKTSTYQQKAVVLLVKQGANWLVDGFSWAKP